MRYTFGAIYPDGCDMLPYGNDKKEFISYRNRMEWGYIEFAKQIYRTSVSEYIAKNITFKLLEQAMKKDIFGCLFLVIFAFGNLYCYAVIFGFVEWYYASHS